MSCGKYSARGMDSPLWGQRRGRHSFLGLSFLMCMEGQGPLTSEASSSLRLPLSGVPLPERSLEDQAFSVPISGCTGFSVTPNGAALSFF